MSYEQEQWDKMIAECRRRGYDPHVMLRLARAFEKVKNAQIKKRKRKKKQNVQN